MLALYARVSSAEQVDGHSLDFQVKDMREAAGRDGFTVVEVFRDEGVSAKTDKRPEFQRMIADAKARRFVRIYVWKFDRFARNVHDAVVHKTLLKSVGVELVSVKEPLSDPQSPASELLQLVMDGVAQWYSSDLTQKMRRAKQARAESGRYDGDLPFGYVKACGHRRCTLKDCTDNLPVACSEEASVVLTIFDRYSTGNQSMREIADFVNTLGFQTRNKRKKSEHGVVGPRPFTKDSIRDVLTNAFYLGKIP